jgi:CheY-like chemotaxis protein
MSLGSDVACCWNCDAISRNAVTVPIETPKGGRVSFTLCHTCFTQSLAPLLDSMPPPFRNDASSWMTVLVVDDDPRIRRLLRLALEGTGFHVDSAANGMEALAKITQVQPDAIVLDLRMPIMSGADFLKVLRQTADGQSIPVLAISAYGSSSLKTELGVEAFLAKPFEMSELLGTVSGLIAGAA